MRKYFSKNKSHKRQITKRNLATISVFLIATVLIVAISTALATSPSNSTNTAGPETQFDLDIAYTYVGPRTKDDSYTEEDGVKMYPASLNPSLVIFNITRKIGTQIPSCDAVLELYEIQITTDTGLTEKACYFIGTNYKPSFSNNELSVLFAKVNSLSSPEKYYTTIGNFQFNMTENTPVVGTPIGSYGAYSSAYSTDGLYKAGKPNTVSVSVQRICYITISDGSVSIYEDAPTSNVKAMAQLSNDEEGFIHNDLVPAAELSQTELFHPIS